MAVGKSNYKSGTNTQYLHEVIMNAFSRFLIVVLVLMPSLLNAADPPHARFENTKAVIQKSIAALNQGDTSVVEQAIASDYKYYSPSNAKTPLSREEMLAQLKTAMVAFPNLHWQIEAMYAADDWVITRFVIRGIHKGDFQGIPATGNQIEYSSIVICRFKEGQIIEEREELNLLGVMQQLNLGLQPKPQ
jgi:steroid delta-isomerase-like uncharacterized protein